jgi:AraC-like DNA-binding protein
MTPLPSALDVSPVSPRDSSKHELLHTARSFIDENCMRVVTSSELSALTGLNPFRLSRCFREAFGLPPYAYLERRRAERARALIDSGLPISAVAFRAGYADQSHLTRKFKRAFGITPGRYRRALLDGASRLPAARHST